MFKCAGIKNPEHLVHSVAYVVHFTTWCICSCAGAAYFADWDLTIFNVQEDYRVLMVLNLVTLKISTPESNCFSTMTQLILTLDTVYFSLWYYFSTRKLIVNDGILTITFIHVLHVSAILWFLCAFSFSILYISTPPHPRVFMYIAVFTTLTLFHETSSYW